LGCGWLHKKSLGNGMDMQSVFLSLLYVQDGNSERARTWDDVSEMKTSDLDAWVLLPF